MLHRNVKNLINLRHAFAELLAPAVLPSTHSITDHIRQLHQLKQSNDLRVGNIIEQNGKLYEVVKQQHNQGTGRQLGNVQLELRDIANRSKHPLKLRTSDMIPVVRLDENKYQYLYHDDNSIHLMDAAFNQITLDKDLFGRQAGYLQEGMDVTVQSHEGLPIMAVLPANVVLTVIDAPPTMKDATAAPQYKKAVVEGGAVVQVPPFVNKGDKVVVDTATGEFVKRAS